MMESYVDPTRAAFDLFKSLPRDTPINMLNLVRYRDLAAYSEGHGHAGKGWTGPAPMKNMAPPVARFLSG